MASSLKDFKIICNALFKEATRSREICVEILEKIAEQGFFNYKSYHGGLYYYVLHKLEKSGLLRRVKVPACGENKLEVVWVANRSGLARWRTLLEELDKSAPGCVST